MYQEMDMEHFYQRLELAWKAAGFYDRADFTNRNTAGITKQDITHWKDGKEPSIKKLVAISNACGCDIDFLLGRTNTIRAKNQSIKDETGLSETAIDTLREYRQKAAIMRGLLYTAEPGYMDGIQSNDDFSEHYQNTSTSLTVPGLISYLITSDELEPICESIIALARADREKNRAPEAEQLQDVAEKFERQTFGEKYSEIVAYRAQQADAEFQAYTITKRLQAIIEHYIKELQKGEPNHDTK